MSKEKTIEELKAELEALKKENLERELNLEKVKIEAAKKEEEEKEQDKLRDEMREEIRNELLENETTQSKVDVKEEKETFEGVSAEWEKFSDNYIKEHELKGISYEDLTKKISKGGHKGKR